MKLLTTLLESTPIDDLAEPTYRTRSEEYDKLEKQLTHVELIGAGTMKQLQQLVDKHPHVGSWHSQVIKRVKDEENITIQPESLIEIGTRGGYQFERIYISDTIFVWTKDQKMVNRIKRLVNTWIVLSKTRDELKQKISYVRQAKRKEEIENEKQNVTSPRIVDENKIPKYITAPTSNTTFTYENPYWGKIPSHRWAGHPSHFTKWPAKTKAAYADLLSVIKAAGVSGFTELYAYIPVVNVTGQPGKTRELPARFIAIANEGRLVWARESDDGDGKIYSVYSQNHIRAEDVRWQVRNGHVAQATKDLFGVVLRKT